MTKISYTLYETSGSIHWSAAEQFNELQGKTFMVGEMQATQIEKLNNISQTAKILLSAVAGAVIQHLIDRKIDPELIFSKGTFRIEK